MGRSGRRVPPCIQRKGCSGCTLLLIVLLILLILFKFRLSVVILGLLLVLHGLYLLTSLTRYCSSLWGGASEAPPLTREGEGGSFKPGPPF